MKNQNVADISVFENLQNNTNNSFASQMNVFNGNCSIENSAIFDKAESLVKKFVADIDLLVKEGTELVKLRNSVIRMRPKRKDQRAIGDILDKEQKRITQALKENPNDPEALADQKQALSIQKEFNASDRDMFNFITTKPNKEVFLDSIYQYF
ncbi:MAG: hypothetical protein LBP59_10535 [Planctomycetaceae bacterium]|jgi:hypothetical protein|nr:hypothetical protein [Planctomycetaceae bacterium]